LDAKKKISRNLPANEFCCRVLISDLWDRRVCFDGFERLDRWDRPGEMDYDIFGY
jgi:hypothetical protein